MPCQTFSPVAALAPFVESIYFISRPAAAPEGHLISPTGFMDLVLHLDNRAISWCMDGRRYSVAGPVLAGAYSKPFLLDVSEFTAVLGVRFQPGAARLFFPLPAHELHNLDIALADVYRVDAARLVDDVLQASPLAQQVAVLQRYLVNKLKHAAGVDGAVAYAVRQFRRPEVAVSVAQVESAVGLSHTRFIQVFREHVGMTPKLFCRVMRFQKAVQAIERGEGNWAAVAAGCGYFDQAHLIRDFREFCGLTPLAYAEHHLAYQQQAALAAG